METSGVCNLRGHETLRRAAVTEWSQPKRMATCIAPVRTGGGDLSLGSEENQEVREGGDKEDTMG